MRALSRWKEFPFEASPQRALLVPKQTLRIPSPAASGDPPKSATKENELRSSYSICRHPYHLTTSSSKRSCPKTGIPKQCPGVLKNHAPLKAAGPPAVAPGRGHCRKDQASLPRAWSTGSSLRPVRGRPRRLKKGAKGRIFGGLWERVSKASWFHRGLGGGEGHGISCARCRPRPQRTSTFRA